MGQRSRFQENPAQRIATSCLDRERHFLLILRVARGLRYRSVDAMIDQTVTVSSIRAVVPDIRAFVQRFCPDCVYKDLGSDPVLSLAKYGLLDLEFRAPDSHLLLEFSTGIPLLKELGFLSDTDDGLDDDNELALLGCREDLEQGIKKDGTLLKVFLIDLEKRHATDLRDRMWLMRHPSQIPFPIDFRVIDACVTNSGGVWIIKHFYL